jgi:hypothetical protein
MLINYHGLKTVVTNNLLYLGFCQMGYFKG